MGRGYGRYNEQFREQAMDLVRVPPAAWNRKIVDRAQSDER